MHALVVTLVLAGVAPELAERPAFDFSGAFEGRANPLDDYGERQRCLSAAGVGLAGALGGAALLGGATWLVGAATYRGVDGELVGSPDPTTQRFFVPGFAAGGAFLGGALATLATYYLVEPDDRPGVTR